MEVGLLLGSFEDAFINYLFLWRALCNVFFIPLSNTEVFSLCGSVGFIFLLHRVARRFHRVALRFSLCALCFFSL